MAVQSPIPGTRRFLAAIAVTVLAGLSGGLVAASPAAASAAGACDSLASGVTVIVDFGEFGSTQVACAPGDPSSGLAALRGAGFAITPTQRFGTFVCRISGIPADDPCIDTPPPNRSWSYWQGRDGVWVYSGQGGGSYNPAPGAIEGWSFGSGAAPRVAPPVPPPPPPVQPPPAGGGGSGGGGTGGGGTGGGTGGTGGGSGGAPSDPATTDGATDGAAPDPSTASPTGSPTTAPSSGAQSSDAAATQSRTTAAATAPPSGGMRGTLLGLGVVAILAGLAGLVAVVRRRRATPADPQP